MSECSIYIVCQCACDCSCSLWYCSYTLSLSSQFFWMYNYFLFHLTLSLATFKVNCWIRVNYRYLIIYLYQKKRSHYFIHSKHNRFWGLPQQTHSFSRIGNTYGAKSSPQNSVLLTHIQSPIIIDNKILRFKNIFFKTIFFSKCSFEVIFFLNNYYWPDGKPFQHLLNSFKA